MIKSDPAKILIVDDEDDTRQFLYDFLEQLGHKVKAVANGKTALQLAINEPPDVILLDVMMPEMSGLEVCQKLKENSETKNIPVIFVTAKATVNDQVTGLMLGAHDYINKPYRITELTARLNSALKVKRLQDELQICKETNLQLLNNHNKHYQKLINSKELAESIKNTITEENKEKIELLVKCIDEILKP